MSSFFLQVAFILDLLSSRTDDVTVTTPAGLTYSPAAQVSQRADSGRWHGYTRFMITLPAIFGHSLTLSNSQHPPTQRSHCIFPPWPSYSSTPSPSLTTLSRLTVTVRFDLCRAPSPVGKPF